MANSSLFENLFPDGDFVHRHIGLSDTDLTEMLTTLDVDNINSLIQNIVPNSILLTDEPAVTEPLSEENMLSQLKDIASKNQCMTQYIGQGYYGTYMPAVILRNVFENPAWYTAYTPYQPEISQGRLTSLLNFQQMVLDLTAMDVANASLLDEATAAAEAMTLCMRSSKSKTARFFAADHLHPQTLEVLKTRAHFVGIELIIQDISKLNEHDVFGVLFQHPTTQGQLVDIKAHVDMIHQQGALAVVATDLLALTLLTPPGECGADIVVGSAQRFGVPMGLGGPHAAFMAVKDKLKRSMPGRIIGVSKDRHDNPALRMAMQTREQHIRREKATSNICTAQALLANIAAFYAVYHGAEGLKKIARRVHHLTQLTAKVFESAGLPLVHEHFFDTLMVSTGEQTQAFISKARKAGFNLRCYPDHIGMSFDETTKVEDINLLLSALLAKPINILSQENGISDERMRIPASCQRTTSFLTHPVFTTHNSETQLMRYIKQLENKDFSLVHGMIPLGSCTMKLNAASEMMPVSWPQLASLHPFSPPSQQQGYLTLTTQLAEMLCRITGYDAMSLQPNSGAQGELAGLIAIQRYHQARGERHRNICLIPSSAHGTNPASASMVSLKVVVVECDQNGNIDLIDLTNKITEHRQNLSCIMVTYPSTHGVFEEEIQTICQQVHDAGGQVYLDGANMNAQVGLTNPALIGADVSHLNLHKTFCIPHGGGGPGMGPIGVRQHLAPYLPEHQHQLHRNEEMTYAVAAARFGSASILPISWAYIKMMGSQGLRAATEIAILNANYIMTRLSDHYPILYRGKSGWIAHECIIDIRPIKTEIGITEEDIAKRLMDYGFHAPTMSFPVAGTLMIEPTESEDKAELDRFCDAMIQIREEIRCVHEGQWPVDNNPLVNAPHTQFDLYSEEWVRPYSREIACFPSHSSKQAKFWPSVNRVDNVYGDRNLVCTCPPLDDYR